MSCPSSRPCLILVVGYHDRDGDEEYIVTGYLINPLKKQFFEPTLLIRWHCT